MITKPSILLILGQLLLSSCQTIPDVSHLNLNYQDITTLFKARKNDFDMFFKPGPMEVISKLDITFTLKQDLTIEADLFLPKQDIQAPLLIFQHGNKSSKEFHRKQAMLAASWGLNALAVKQPNQGQWVKNGKDLRDLVRFLSLWPERLNNKFDPNAIILVGHSFGGSAIAIAGGDGATVLGLIFLDPAFVHNTVKPYLKNIQVPSVIIGADKSVFKSRKRNLFHKLLEGPKLEFSIKGSTHNDAQYPNMFSWKQTLNFAPAPSQERQDQFAAAIVGSAYGIASDFSTEKIVSGLESSTKLDLKNLKN